MSDHKFERQYDRRIVLSDEKQRLIDLMANPFVLPDVDIYDEPVRYYKLNLQWAKIVFGWLDWLEDVAGWAEAQDDSFSGINQILKFEEGIEPVGTVEDICAGVTCALEDLAKRYLTGTGEGGFTINADGSISTDGATLPDDPDTPENENAMSIAGGCIAVRIGINQLLEDIANLYGVDAAEDNTLADSEFIISSKYKVDLTALDLAMTEYWADRAASKVQIDTIDTLLLDSELFCEGVSKQTINTVIVGITAFSIEARQNAVGLVNALTDEQIQDWYNDGVKLPTSQYLVYSCVPIEPETILCPFGSGQSSVFSWKAFHRMQLRISGNMIDTVNIGRSRDFFWQTEADGSHTFVPSLFAWTQGAFPPPEPTSTEVPYRASHVYILTLDTGSAGPFIPVTGKGTVDNSINGDFTIEIVDLGEYRG